MVNICIFKISQHLFIFIERVLLSVDVINWADEVYTIYLLTLHYTIIHFMRWCTWYNMDWCKYQYIHLYLHYNSRKQNSLFNHLWSICEIKIVVNTLKSYIKDYTIAIKHVFVECPVFTADLSMTAILELLHLYKIR